MSVPTAEVIKTPEVLAYDRINAQIRALFEQHRHSDSNVTVWEADETDPVREATSEYPVTANFNHIGADGITVPDWPTLDLSVWLESRSKNESTVEGLDIPRFCFRASTARVDSVGPQYRDDYDPVLTSARLVRLESTPTELVFDKFLVWRKDHIAARRFTITDPAQLRVRENIATVGEHRAYDELDLGQLEDLESRLTTLVSFLGATTLTEA